MVWKSCETRMRSCSAASASTLGSGTPVRFASFAERKSIVGSLRKQPATIPSLRSASAKKRIISSGSSRQQLLPRALQLFLEVGRRRVRLRELVLYALALHDVILHFAFVTQVEGNRAIHRSEEHTSELQSRQ